VKLFAIFPEAQNMLVRWGKTNLQTLNSETARQYLLEIIIPFCQERCNSELHAFGVPAMGHNEFMKFVGLKTLCAATAWRWLRLLGFEYKIRRKCYYTDGHEKEENVRYRLDFIAKYFNFELRTYRWVQLKEEDAIALEELDKKPHAKDLARKQFTSADGSRMREYHIDCHEEQLIKYVSDENQIIHGADLSIDLPEGARPLLIIGQDELVFYQYLFSSKAWLGPDGQSTLVPKLLGATIMASAFTGDQLGFGYRPTDEQIDEINRRRRTGKHYVSTESAKHRQTERTNKPELTKEMFAADLIDSPFLKQFKFGAATGHTTT
jgi:hypothetical protein